MFDERRVGARRQHARRADRAGDEARLVGRRVLVARRARELRGGDVDLADLVAESPFARAGGASTGRCRSRRRRTPTARNDSWIAWMTSGRVRTRLSLQPFERLAAEVLGREVVALDVRPHRAVVDEHAALRGSRR